MVRSVVPNWIVTPRRNRTRAQPEGWPITKAEYEQLLEIVRPDAERCGGGGLGRAGLPIQVARAFPSLPAGQGWGYLCSVAIAIWLLLAVPCRLVLLQDG